MINPLVNRKYAIATVPDRYQASMQNVLRKGSDGARLRDKSANYFEVGLRISWLTDKTDLAAAIFSGVLNRLRMIIDRSAFSVRDEESEGEFLHLLTNFEHRIYIDGVESNENFNKWKHGLLACLKPHLPIAILRGTN